MDDQRQHRFGEYVAAWRQRLARQEEERRARTLRMQEVARACARLLVQDFGVRRVYLFGSLVDPDLAHDRSDIDLAVEGLEKAAYWRALSDVWRLLPAGVELDLVPLEDAWPGLAERVRAEGVLLDGTE